MADEIEESTVVTPEATKTETTETKVKAPVEPPKGSDEDLVQKIVKEKLETELQPIKGKLDNAYKARDEALAKVAEFERREKEARLQALRDEGKDREVWGKIGRAHV